MLPTVSTDYCLVSDHDSPQEKFSSNPTVMVELSPCSSNEENSLDYQGQRTTSFPYSPTALASLKTGTAQAQDLIETNFPKSSNLLFFAGAFCQFVVAAWDLKYAEVTAVVNATAVVVDDGNYIMTRTDEASYLFYTLGPLLYFCKAILDIRRSIQSPSRKNNRWNIVAGVIFCLGATFAIYDSILYDAHEDQDDADDDNYLLAVAASRTWFGSEFRMNEIATHLYLISGAIYLSLHTGCFHGWQQTLNITAPPLALAYRILICGTMLFVLGAIMDAILAYFYDPETLDKINHDDAIPATDLGLAKASVASAIPWTLAPIMYILVDVLVQHYLKEHTHNYAVTSPDFLSSEVVRNVNDRIENEVVPFI
jgi:hypothetical protein